VGNLDLKTYYILQFKFLIKTKRENGERETTTYLYRSYNTQY
jgi:hypothetical protein